MDIESELGIEATADKAEIRRAYARRLKETHPEDDPEGFQRLRAAYEAALQYAEYMIGDQAAEPDRPEPDHAEELVYEPAAASPPRHARRPATDPAAGPTPDDESTRNRDALDGMLRNLADLLDAGEEGMAVEALNAALAEPLLLNLDYRRSFELRLLTDIGERKPVPSIMAKAAIAAFRWDEQWTNLPGEYQYLADRLMAVPLAEERLAELRRDAKKFWTRNFDEIAARLLLGPYQPIRFGISAGPDMMDAMTRLLTELRAQFPAILQHAIDPRVLAWWERVTTNPQPYIDKRTRRFTWTVIGLSVALGVAQVFFEKL